MTRTDLGDKTIGSLLKNSAARLHRAGIDAADLDARLLLQSAAGLAHHQIIGDPGRVATPRIADKYGSHIDRRIKGEPVHRIIGHREFWGLELQISPAVLDPRADTERLVEAVLEWVDNNGGRQNRWQIADIGTGSGAVILALLSELKQASAVASDISTGALKIARANAERYALAARVMFIEGSYLDPLNQKFDLIVSNPPYIVSSRIDHLAREVREHDPRIALDGGADGLDAYRLLLAGSANYLRPQGAMLMEIGHDQAEYVDSLARQSGWQNIKIMKDIGGNDRVFSASR